VIDARLLPRESRAFLDGLAEKLRGAVLSGWLACIAGLDELPGEDRTLRDKLRELFRVHPDPLALRLAPQAAVPFDPGYIPVDLPIVDETRRISCWRAAFARHQIELEDAPERLAARYRVGPGVIERAVAQAAVRQHLDVRLAGVAQRVERLASWSNVILPPDVSESLRELVGRIKHRQLVYERWGFDKKMSTSRGLTALFQGGPGTGKTMVAGAIARELGLDLYRVDLSKIMSKWIGETEQNLAQVFDAAEDGQAIVLFDEADSLFAKRTDVKSSVDRYSNLEVNDLLQRLDSFDGIAILTTNFGSAIDAAFLAAEEGKPLSQTHLERAVELEFREVGKLSQTGVLE